VSFQAMAWAWEPRPITPLARLTLLHLANSANQDGDLRSSVDRIMAQTGMTKKETKDAIAELVREDLLLVDQDDNGSILAHVPFYDAKAPSSIVNLKREFRMVGAAWKRRRQIILARDNFRCVYCGETEADLHIDHIVPISRGGTNDESNLATACATCNSSKRDKMLSEWRAS
jgi:hypothetical protein